MSISLEQLTQILAKAGISSSQEEEILIVAKRFTTPPEVKEELCTSYQEQLCEKMIEKDEEGISGDQNHEEYHANKTCIEQYFHVSSRLDQFSFCFDFVKSRLQQLISHIFVHVRIHFANSNVNLHLILLHRWLHWKFNYT